MIDTSREDPPREGVRGGREQFRWDSVRTQSLRDRECYLGQSTMIGMQGRFGRYQVHDWWHRQSDSNTENDKSDKTSQQCPMDADLRLAKNLEAQLQQKILGKTKTAMKPVPHTGSLLAHTHMHAHTSNTMVNDSPEIKKDRKHKDKHRDKSSRHASHRKRDRRESV